MLVRDNEIRIVRQELVDELFVISDVDVVSFFIGAHARYRHIPHLACLVVPRLKLVGNHIVDEKDVRDRDDCQY